MKPSLPTLTHWGINMIKDNVNFIDKNAFLNIMNIFGWNAKDDFLIHKDMAVVRADFYPTGHVFAISKKAVIVCDGKMEIEYKGKTYTDFSELYDKYGNKAFDTFSDWDIKVEKQWTVKKNGQWCAAFTNLAEMPYRKAIRC